ncbi:MAG: PAS domain S-box protein [Geobacteraceae bacterium]|nr:PAS domain S-box protein [Geobacteraceae bacterium]
MSLFSRNFYITAVSLLILLMAIMLTARVIILDSFIHIEENKATQHIERINSALMKELALVDAACSDYATWDDAFRFMKGSNPDFIRLNLSDLSLSKLKIDFVSFILLDGEEVFSKVVLSKQSSFSPYRDLKPYLFDGNRLVNIEGGVKGLVLSGGLPMIISSRPILTSEGKGPVSGVLIMGRVLDTEELQSLSELIRLPLSIYFPDKEAPKTIITIKRPDTSIINASYLFSDINGKPAFSISAKIPRDIYLEGDRTVKHFIYTVLFGFSLVIFTISRLTGRLTVAEKERQITETLYNAVVERSSSTSIIMDAETCRVIKSTPEVSRMLGYSPEQLHGVLFRELLHESLDSFESCLSALHEDGGGSASAMLKLRKKDSSIISANAEINSRIRDGKSFFVLHINMP